MVQNISNYTFSASTKEITLTGISVNVEKVRLIKNLTTNTFIYKFTDSLTISAIGSIITFTADNTGMSNTDKLVIQYDLDTSVDIQKTTITDGAGIVNTKQLGTTLTSSDVGLVSQSVIHGLSTVGGGSYVDVKVNPSGALTVEATIEGAVDTGLLQPLTDTQLRASAIPVSGTFFQSIQPISTTSLPLPTGAATEVTLNSINDKLPTAISDMPNDVTSSIPVRQSPQKYNDCSFANVGSGLLTSDFTQIAAGSGMTVSQSGGNLVITTGTTANAEFVARGVYQVNGAQTLKEITTLSQRIVNNNFFIELVDIIGDALPYNIINTTTVDVTKTTHGFTTRNIGQRIDLCALSSVGIPMEGVITSIPDDNTIRFTVAGYPASGFGTLSLTGYNKIELLYIGTTATNVSFNTRRRGWQNTATTPTINTTASGHLLSVNSENGISSLSDKTLVAGNALTDRTSWDTNIPEPSVNLFVQIRAKNGTTAPASTTTWTIGMVRVEDYIASQVSLVSTRQQSLNNSLPVRVLSAPTTAVSGTLTSAGTTTNTPVTPTASIINSAATTNGTVVKASAGTLYSITVSSTRATTCFLKFHNSTTVTAGTTVVALTIAVPTNSTITVPFGATGMRFGTGICLSITSLAADNDTTAIGVGEVKVLTAFI